jgi:hypothetical protein
LLLLCVSVTSLSAQDAFAGPMPLFMSSFYSKPESKADRERILATPVAQLARVSSDTSFVDLTITFVVSEVDSSAALRTPTVRVHLTN